MAVADLNTAEIQVNSSKDNIIIREVISTVVGGRTLNVTGFTPEIIYAGHPIIKETATGDYKPLPIDAGGLKYATLPGGHTYVGICDKTTLKKLPTVGILTRGEVNYKAAYHDYVDILSAIKTALPRISFAADKD